MTAASKKNAKPSVLHGVSNGMMRAIRSCYRAELFYTRQVRISWIYPCLTLLAALPPLVAGCGGITASHTFSPLDFLMPGLIKADPPQTNAPVAFRARNSMEVVTVR
jgi:hypothetical protein